MQAIDTNVLVRLLINDDVKQGQIIYRLFDDCYRNNQQLFVGAVVIVETIWVLSKHYQMPRNEVIQAIQDVLSMNVTFVEYHAQIQTALSIGSTNNYDLSDLIIGCIANENKCNTTLTFDKKASKSNYFTLLK